MFSIYLLDSPKLFQWDLNRQIKIIGKEEVDEVHFSHIGDEEALVVKPIKENNFLIANIPNILLQEHKDIFVYLVSKDKTLKETFFTVGRREKPTDYLYTEIDILNYSSLEKRLAELEEKLNNISVEETDPTVPDWAKQPNKPRYTAAEVGALSSTETVQQLAKKQDKSNLVTSINESSVDSTYPSTRAVYEYVGKEFARLIGSAPDALDTIEELANAFNNNQDVLEALNEAITKKQDKDKMTTSLSSDSTDDQYPSAKAVFNHVDNKVFEVGASIVQSDYEQNDNTQKDYIKNRPFYEYYTKGDVVFYGSSLQPYYPFGQSGIQLENGKDYVVVINGDEFIVKCGTALNLSDNKSIVLESNIIRLIGFSSSSYEFAILECNSIVVPLDEKYIPSTIPRVSTASVGQILSVKAVDENGKPSEWEMTEPYAMDISKTPGYQKTAMAQQIIIDISNPFPLGFYFSSSLYTYYKIMNGDQELNKYALAQPRLIEFKKINATDVIFVFYYRTQQVVQYHYSVNNNSWEENILNYAAASINSKLNEKISNPLTATVGQILEVEEVDENGVPTKWIAVDKPTDVDLSEYVKFTDYATKDKGGTARIYSTGDVNVPGVGISGTGILGIVGATNANIDSKITSKPITPSNLDYAVKAGMTTNALEWTDEEKQAARDLIGAVDSGVEVTSGEPTKETTVMTLNPNADEVNLYTAEEIDAKFDAFINAEEVAY